MLLMLLLVLVDMEEEGRPEWRRGGVEGGVGGGGLCGW